MLLYDLSTRVKARTWCRRRIHGPPSLLSGCRRARPFWSPARSPDSRGETIHTWTPRYGLAFCCFKAPRWAWREHSRMDIHIAIHTATAPAQLRLPATTRQLGTHEAVPTARTAGLCYIQQKLLMRLVIRAIGKMCGASVAPGIAIRIEHLTLSRRVKESCAQGPLTCLLSPLPPGTATAA